MREIAGVIILIQGVLGFAGTAFLDRDMGFVHQFADIPSAGYLAMALVGVALTVWGANARRARR